MTKFILGFLLACLLWILILHNIEIPEYKIYDCSMAEWNQEIPRDVREECRKLYRKQERFL